MGKDREIVGNPLFEWRWDIDWDLLSRSSNIFSRDFGDSWSKSKDANQIAIAQWPCLCSPRRCPGWIWMAWLNREGEQRC